MKYALKALSFSPQKGHFEYLYYCHGNCFTMKLGQATIWDNVDLIENIIIYEGIDDYQVVRVTEKELFEVRLKG